MPRVAPISLRDLLRASLDEDELELFIDWDHLRGDGRGFFSSDRHECTSRRVDLRGPTDLDPGPLPMEEDCGEEIAHRLVFVTSEYFPG